MNTSLKVITNLLVRPFSEILKPSFTAPEITTLTLKTLSDLASSSCNSTSIDLTKFGFDKRKAFEIELKLWRLNPYITGDKATALERIDHAYKNNSPILDLSSLNLSSLPPSIGNLTHLRILNLDKNKLSSIPTSIGNLTKLEKLSLSNNKLATLPKEIEALQELQALSLNNNELTILPGEIGFLAKLKHVEVDNNKLKLIPSQIGMLSQLEKLSLDSNLIESLPSGVGNLSSLQNLSLKSNNLADLPPDIGNLRNLEVLTLGHNNLKTLPSQIGNLTLLTQLEVDHNELESLPQQIGNLVSLKTLDLESNLLPSLPAQIGNLAQLQKLSLNNNLLSFLPLELGNLQQLEFLSLEYNSQLCELPLSLGNAPQLVHLFTTGTRIPSELARGILRASLAQRNQNAGMLLTSRLDKWLAFTQGDIKDKHKLIESIASFTDGEKQILQEWLLRLEFTKDYQRNQKEIVPLVCKMLKTIAEDQEFKETFINQAAPNNRRCPDRAAMALNDIYVLWIIHTIPNASLREKLDLLIQAAMTQTLRRVILDRLGFNSPESVETILYYEIELSKELNLLSPMKNMLYAPVGNRFWSIESIRNEVLDRYFEYLLEYPAFQKLEKECEEDNEFATWWQEMLNGFQVSMEDLLEKKDNGLITATQLDIEARKLKKHQSFMKLKLMYSF